MALPARRRIWICASATWRKCSTPMAEAATAMERARAMARQVAQPSPRCLRHRHPPCRLRILLLRRLLRPSLQCSSRRHRLRRLFILLRLCICPTSSCLCLLLRLCLLLCRRLRLPLWSRFLRSQRLSLSKRSRDRHPHQLALHGFGPEEAERARRGDWHADVRLPLVALPLGQIRRARLLSCSWSCAT